MSLTQLLLPEAVLPALRVPTKRQALLDLAQRASRISGLPVASIRDSILKREGLGSTAVGGGIAIPHGKVAQATSIFGVFARLAQPIDFEALDGNPVDLIFLLLAPDTAGAGHLRALAQVARLMRDPAVVARLRATHHAAGLYAVLTADPPTSEAA